MVKSWWRGNKLDRWDKRSGENPGETDTLCILCYCHLILGGIIDGIGFVLKCETARLHKRSLASLRCAFPPHPRDIATSLVLSRRSLWRSSPPALLHTVIFHASLPTLCRRHSTGCFSRKDEELCCLQRDRVNPHDRSEIFKLLCRNSPDITL